MVSNCLMHVYIEGYVAACMYKKAVNIIAVMATQEKGIDGCKPGFLASCSMIQPSSCATKTEMRSNLLFKLPLLVMVSNDMHMQYKVNSF